MRERSDDFDRRPIPTEGEDGVIPAAVSRRELSTMTWCCRLHYIRDNTGRIERRLDLSKHPCTPPRGGIYDDENSLESHRT